MFIDGKWTQIKFQSIKSKVVGGGLLPVSAPEDDNKLLLY